MNCGAQDVLGTMPTEDVWHWYGRLATRIGQIKVGGREPMAARFLGIYVAPRSGSAAPTTFDAPPYLRTHSLVRDALAHHRAVYLTEERMRSGGGSSKWAGIRPRWENPSAYGWDRVAPLTMHYTALIQVPLRWQVTGNDAELDILHALGLGFQLRTDVTCRVAQQAGAARLDVTFESFQAQIEDRYDFDFSEHLTVPNPDHNSTAAGAVCPAKETMVVYHTNAQRLENAHLAAPFDLRSAPWNVGPGGLAGPGVVSL